METTINIRVDIFEQIAGAAQSRGISCSDMIMLLLKKSAGDVANPECFGRLVRYQCRQRKVDWHVFHIKVREDMYEYWLDMRKFLKMSVSLMLALAVMKYLGKPLEINGTDNNRCKNYVLIKTVIDNIIIWKLIWGYPQNLGNLINNKN
jgi:hypothetical protein